MVRHGLETQWFHFNTSPSSDSLINQKPATDVILRCCYYVITGTGKLSHRDLKSNSCYWLWLRCLIYKCRCYLVKSYIYVSWETKIKLRNIREEWKYFQVSWLWIRKISKNTHTHTQRNIPNRYSMPWADWITSVHTELLLIPFKVSFAFLMTYKK